MEYLADKHEIEKNNLLDIFLSEEDKNGTDLLAMSNYFNVFIGKIKSEMETATVWETFNPESLIGSVASAIKGGFDISNIGTFVADNSHFGQDIIDGLKEGIYHVGQSKEFEGNFRPAILDKNEKLVKFFTLKKAIDPSSVLFDVSMWAIQVSLQRISSQIDDVGRDVKRVIDFVRREKLSNKFIYARDKIMRAATADANEQDGFLKEADTYLMEGLTDLYADINAQVRELAEQNGPFAKIKEIDSLLSYINEDMQMIPRYVGLRVYLFNFRANYKKVNRKMKKI